MPTDRHHRHHRHRHHRHHHHHHHQRHRHRHHHRRDHPVPKNTVAEFTPSVPHAKFIPGEQLKLSLAYADSKFIVPWTTLGDGSTGGQVLSTLVLTFLYSGSDIVQVKWSGEYEAGAGGGRGGGKGEGAGGEGNDGGGGAKRDEGLEPLSIKYEWTEVVEHDVESGLIVLFGTTLLLGKWAPPLASLVRVRRAGAERRPTPHARARTRTHSHALAYFSTLTQITRTRTPSGGARVCHLRPNRGAP